MELNTASKMICYVKTLKYLVVFPDKKTQIYSSLREISEDICVDYTTNLFQKALILSFGSRKFKCINF